MGNFKTQKTIEYIDHEEPVWRERANFIIHTQVDENNANIRLEQLWARQLTENHFEICCIPFFAYNLALGDQVETRPHLRLDHSYIVHQVTSPSGRYTFRIWFLEPKIRQSTALEIEEMGFLLEWFTKTGNLLAIDAESAERAQILANILLTKEKQGLLIYETGKT